jgi:hypothetical protein
MATESKTANDFGGNSLHLLLKLMLLFELLLICLDILYPETSSFKKNINLLLVDAIGIAAVHFCLKKAIR